MASAGVALLGGGFFWFRTPSPAPAPLETPAKPAEDRAALAAAAQQVVAAEASAKSVADRAKAEVATLGLDATGFLADADRLTAQAEDELAKGAFDRAKADFAMASGMVGPETRNFLDQQSGSYARQSQAKLAAGDVEGPEAVLSLAKKIKQSEAGFR